MSNKYIQKNTTMTKKDSKLYLSVAAITLLISQTAISQENFSIEIAAAENQVEYGMPIVVSLRLAYQQPQTWRQTGKSRLLIHVDGLKLLVQNSDTQQTSDFILFEPDFYLEGTRGLEYHAKVVIWCDVHKTRGKLITKMIFPSPGNYLFRVERNDIRSNDLELVVKPSQLGQRAMSLLKDPNDFAFLRGGTNKSERAISTLREVVKQCKGSVLAKWAAARLGIEYFRDFHRKHPSFEDFRILRKRKAVEEPLFDQVHEYLAIGAELPEEFPVRQDVISKLSVVEFMDGNFEKAILLVDELATKYPKMKYGRRASQMKQELLEFQKKEREKAQQLDAKD
jgi:hypothetical protein